MRGRASRGVVALAAATALAGPGAATARTGDPSLVGRGCTEAVAAVPVTEERANAVLPDDWAPVLGEAGLATLGVGVLRCDELDVGAAAIDGGSVSDVGVLVKPPPGFGGVAHFYQLWQHTDVGALHGLTSALGLPGVRTTVGLDLTSPSLGVGAFTGSVSRPAEAYAIKGSAGPAVTSGGSAPTWWHDGREGRVRLAYSLEGTSTAAGPVTLEAAPGSALARLIGRTSTEAAGLLITIPDLKATASTP